MFSLFSSQTPIGEKIDKATSDLLVAEDWGANLEVCDLVNAEDNGPRDAIKAIIRRLQNKNGQVQLYTLTLLESLVKNCGERFHVAVASKEFMAEFVRLVTSKNAVCNPAREKMLSLLQSWVDAFRGNAKLAGIVDAYQNVRTQGVEFPAQDLDTLAPIHTPKATIAPVLDRRSSQSSQSDAPPPLVHAPPVPAPQSHTSQAPTQRIQPSPAQLDKLRSDLATVHANVAVLRDMMGHRDADPLVLSELHATCRAMQERVLRLLDQVADEVLIVELLTVNDELNVVFGRYEQRTKQPAAKESTAHDTQGPPTGLLVDIDAAPAQASAGMDRYAASTYSDGDTGPLHSSIHGAIKMKGDVEMIPDEDPFSAFADSRSYAASSSGFPVASPFPSEPASQVESSGSTHMSGTDFDAFLSQRSGNSGPENVDTVRDNRKIQMEDANDDLFGL
eukprot:Opistho-2@42988